MTEAFDATFVDMDVIFPSSGGLRLAVTAPGPLDEPYAGDDIRTAQIKVEIVGAMVAHINLSHAQLSELSMGIRRALLHMEGRS